MRHHGRRDEVAVSGLSVEKARKQFLDFFGSGRSLLQMTFDRFAKIIPTENIYIVTNESYADLIKEQLPELAEEQILLEPARRNTAPIIAYAAYHIKACNPEANIVVYFGDKMSPLSDTTNLAPIAAGSTLYEHIGHMFYTTVPATIVSLVVYAIVGMNADVSADITSDTVTTLLSQLSSMYSWNLLIIIPVLIVLGGSLLQKPTIPVMLLSTFVAGIEAVFIQHVALGDVLKATVNGFSVFMIHRAGFDTETCSEAVTKLLNRGGMNGIMSTTLLVFCAFCFAGIMSRAGCLDVVLQKILSVAKSTGALITATVAACITMALTTGNSYLSILIPGEMFRDAYKERGLAAKNLSRTLEDAGTVVVPLIPWSAAGAYMASTLGVETLDYLPWAILCYTGWIFAIIWGFTGFGIAKLADEKKKEN